jgi:hypothetical protein
MQTVALNAVTGNTTSSAINVEGLDDLTIELFASAISSGNGVFTVDVSNDGTNWATGATMLNITQTAVGTYVASITLSSNTTAAAFLRKGFKLIRVVVAVTTDGAYSAIVFGNLRK